MASAEHDAYINRLVEAEIAHAHAASMADDDPPVEDPMERFVPWILGGTIATSVVLTLAGVIAVMFF